jgi:hypothetical protein
MTTLGDLTIWPVAELAKLDDLTEALARADNDHRLTATAMLLVRSDTARPRMVQAVSAEGEEVTLSVAPATLRATIKHPLGHAPQDTVIGPLGPGPVTYFPSTRGLRVVAFTYDEPTERIT